jgi:hypothetical protein
VLRRTDGWWDVVPGEHCLRVGLSGVLVDEDASMARGGSVLSCPPLVWLA